MYDFYIVLIDTTELRKRLEEEIRQFAEAMSMIKSGLDCFIAAVDQLAQQIEDAIMNAVLDGAGDEHTERKTFKRENGFSFPADIRMDLLPWYTSGFE